MLKKLGKEEESHPRVIAAGREVVPTLHDALGFMDPAARTPVIPPRKLEVPFITPAAVACLKSLDDLVHEHRKATFPNEVDAIIYEEPLGNDPCSFPLPEPDVPWNDQKHELPLAEVWAEWLARRGKDLQDADGLELVRGLVRWAQSDRWVGREWKKWAKSSPARREAARTLAGGQAACKLRYPIVVHSVIRWLMVLSPRDARDYLLDTMEASFALVPGADMEALGRPLEKSGPYVSPYVAIEDVVEQDWRETSAFKMWSDALWEFLSFSGQELTSAQAVRLWRLMHWRDEPFPGARRRRVDVHTLLTAYGAKAANLTDVADHLLGERGTDCPRADNFNLLYNLTERKRPGEVGGFLGEHPEVQDLVDRAVARILDLELNRGDAPTAATAPAQSIQALLGVETLRRILHALGKEEFKIGSLWPVNDLHGRRQTLTQLAKVTFPADGETPEDFTRLMKAAVRGGEFPEERLLQLTPLAPQWTKAVEAYLGWEG